jgi:hypothetical protein
VAIGRELIYSALFELLQQNLLAPVGPFNFASRRYRPASQTGAANFPAFYLIRGREEYRRELLYGPATVVLQAQVRIQSISGEDPNAVTETVMNNLADAVENVIENYGGPLGTQTLSGLVQVIQIKGAQLIADASGMGRYSEQTVVIEMMTTH